MNSLKLKKYKKMKRVIILKISFYIILFNFISLFFKMSLNLIFNAKNTTKQKRVKINLKLVPQFSSSIKSANYIIFNTESTASIIQSKTKTTETQQNYYRESFSKFHYIR